MIVECLSGSAIVAVVLRLAAGGCVCVLGGTAVGNRAGSGGRAGDCSLQYQTDQQGGQDSSPTLKFWRSFGRLFTLIFLHHFLGVGEGGGPSEIFSKDS